MQTTSRAISNSETAPRRGSAGSRVETARASEESSVCHHQSLIPTVAAPFWPRMPSGRSSITSRNRMKKNICPKAGAT